jgi:hypothetical protein
MGAFETVGRAKMLEVEGNRQIAAALSGRVRALATRVRGLLGKALRSTPGEHQLP